MSEAENIPFYLISDNDNIITKSEIQEFKDNNNEIAYFIDNYQIELRPLEMSHFEALCCWIIGQQISSKVARKITKQFRMMDDKILPEKILVLESDELLRIGLSKSKRKYIKNLAEFFVSNEMPNFKDLSTEEIIKYLCQIKGVGEWTVQMHLIFALGRKDILAAKDLVVRKGVKRIYNLENVPNEREVIQICKKWGHLATLGTILAWSVMGE